MADMKPDRAALVEKVARGISNPDGSEDNWKFWTREAEIAISLIRAEVLEETADAVGEVGDCAEAGAYINAIRALKDTL